MSKGFIDIHTHGIGRYDTDTENPEDILNMARLYAKAGTFAFLPTVYSGTIQQMRVNMEAVRIAIRAQSTEPCTVRCGAEHRTQTGSRRIKNSLLITRNSSLILGVHLEGPFLNPLRCGAQNKNSFIKPTISNLKNLIGGYEDIVKIITIAPELPRALKVIERCASLGIKVNMGHSNATYMQALNGKKAGATGISHIFNAMRPFHHRAPGLAGFGLLDEEVYIEVIADRVHIDFNTLKLIFRTKRRDRVILVSDSVKGTKVKKGPVSTETGTLAGASISVSDAVKNVENIGISAAEAVEAASDNPKRYLTI